MSIEQKQRSVECGVWNAESSALRTPHSALRGVTLIEVLISMVLIALASIATLNYFAYAKGNVAKTGNRRAALERARQRLEQMLAANVSDITPPQDGLAYPVSCHVSNCPNMITKPCVWVPANPNEQVEVEDTGCQPVVATAQWVDDPSAGTGIPPAPVIYDTLAFDVKVWFTPDFGTDDDFNRVHIRTLRTP